MAGRKIRRDEAHKIRRRARYLGRITDSPTDTIKVSRASDYLRALLAEQPENVRRDVAERVVTGLLAVATSLEPSTTTKGAQR